MKMIDATKQGKQTTADLPVYYTWLTGTPWCQYSADTLSSMVDVRLQFGIRLSMQSRRFFWLYGKCTRSGSTARESRCRGSARVCSIYRSWTVHFTFFRRVSELHQRAPTQSPDACPYIRL